jgi:hypothetical protein
MKGGISLQKMLDNDLLLSDSGIKNLNKIRKILKDNKIAHCDIKPANLVVRPPGDEIFLIDNDDIVNFG